MFSIQFIDHEVPYDVFLNDLVNKLVQALKDTHDDPEFISQRKAYKLFGRRNVDRWRRQGKVVCYKRRRPPRITLKARLFHPLPVLKRR